MTVARDAVCSECFRAQATAALRARLHEKLRLHREARAKKEASK